MSFPRKWESISLSVIARSAATRQSPNVGVGFIRSSLSFEESAEKTREKTREKILSVLKATPYITINELAEIVGISQKGVEWQIAKLKKEGRIKRIGHDKGGHWEIIE
jgi:ATP-dependent DNA helicase RecG